jgi:hypothetical protein
MQKRCEFRGLNTGPLDLQSNALPTELNPLASGHFCCPSTNPARLPFYSHCYTNMFRNVIGIEHIKSNFL